MVQENSVSMTTEASIDEKVAELSRGCTPAAARVAVFNWVREIPYAYPSSRDPLEVVRTNQGTCSGKHYLLGQAFRALGLPVRNMLCSHRFNESPLVFPDEMQEMLRKNEVLDFHDYLQVKIGGEWVDVDATWEAGLRQFGFPVNDEWDGNSSLPLSVVPESTEVAAGDPERLKEEQLSKLTPRQRTLRKQFLEALGRWVAECEAEFRVR